MPLPLHTRDFVAAFTSLPRAMLFFSLLRFRLPLMPLMRCHGIIYDMLPCALRRHILMIILCFAD